MIDLSPRKQFQDLRKDDASAFAGMIAQPAVRTALTYALAQLTHQAVTTEELNGAKKFIIVFASLHEDKEQKPLPAKTLQHF
jgi:hypothetical protein